MSEKMLKFVKIGQQTHLKEKLRAEKMILTKSIRILLVKKQRNNLADVPNVEFLFAKFIAL